MATGDIPPYPDRAAEVVALNASLAKMREALQAAHEYLNDMMGPCPPDCDCVIHVIAVALGVDPV